MSHEVAVAVFEESFGKELAGAVLVTGTELDGGMEVGPERVVISGATGAAPRLSGSAMGGGLPPEKTPALLSGSGGAAKPFCCRRTVYLSPDRILSEDMPPNPTRF